MKKKSFNSKNLLVIVAIVIIGIIIALIIVNPFKNIKSNKGKSGIKDVIADVDKVGHKYYDTIYYPYVEDKEGLLSKFTDSGINISLKDIKPVIEFDESLTKGLDKYKCDMEESKIFIYPKAPFGEADYTIKVELSCEKK